MVWGGVFGLVEFEVDIPFFLQLGSSLAFGVMAMRQHGVMGVYLILH